MTDRLQKFWGKTRELKPEVHLAEATPGGGARFLWFGIGMPEMDEEDWRQFEVTPENAAKMVATANAAIAAGEECWVNYGHDEYGRRAGDAVRFELTPEGVFGVVKWNAAARAAILLDPPEWKYFSPEFFATRVCDEKGMPKVVNGKEVFQPFELSCGGSVGALTNRPAMVSLAVTASTSRGSAGSPDLSATPSPGKASPRKEQEMKISPENLALLGLAADANEEQINAAIAERAKPPATPSPEAQAAANTMTAAAAASEVIKTEVARQLAVGQKAEKVAKAVDLAVRTGKVTVAQRADAQKFAEADLEAFEKFVQSAPRVAPVARELEPDVFDASTADFKSADLEKPAVRVALDAAAKKLSAEKSIPYSEAIQRLVAA